MQIYPKIICNIYGGLGNQIFQIYLSTLLMNKYKNKVFINEYYLTRYKRKFTNQVEFLYTNNFSTQQNSRKIDFKNKVLSNIRLTYLFSYIYKKDIVLYIPFIGLLIDSYCQSFGLFQKFTNSEHKNAILIIQKKILNLWKDDDINFNKKTLLHLRLSDFFDNNQEKISYVIEQLNLYSKEGNGIEIITDMEELIEITLKNNFSKANFTLISTKGYSSYEVFKLIYKYQNVITNGSSLAFWASVTSNNNKQFICKEFNLQYNLLYNKMKGIINK